MESSVLRCSSCSREQRGKKIQSKKFGKERKKFLTNQSGRGKLKKLLNDSKNVETPEKNLKKVLDKRKTVC